MSNELNNIISKATNGVLEGVAIGGDRYPGTNFMDHIMRYQADPKVYGRSFLLNVMNDWTGWSETDHLKKQNCLVSLLQKVTVTWFCWLFLFCVVLCVWWDCNFYFLNFKTHLSTRLFEIWLPHSVMCEEYFRMTHFTVFLQCNALISYNKTN